MEPHPDLVAIARRRTRSVPPVTVLEGTAQALPVADASVDIVHARWSYFFGPGCEPGLAELDRVVRRGGTAFVIDNDATRSTFGRWFRRGYPNVDPESVDRFWSTRGWRRTPVDIEWRFDTRADLESVVRIEFPVSWPTRSSPGTRGRPSTTRSTSGRGGSERREVTASRPACPANGQDCSTIHPAIDPRLGTNGNQMAGVHAVWYQTA